MIEKIKEAFAKISRALRKSKDETPPVIQEKIPESKKIGRRGARRNRRKEK